MLALVAPVSSPQSTVFITRCSAVTALRYACASPHCAALVRHHSAPRSSVTTLRRARASPYCAALVYPPHYATLVYPLHYATLVYPPHYALSRSCGVNCAWRRVSCLRHGFRVTPCTSAQSAPRAAGTASAAPPFGPARSSRNGRPDRQRSRRGRSRAWRGGRRQTTAPAG